MNKIINELKEHAPFTAVATILALIATFILSQFISYNSSENIFDSLHLAHILFSAFATTTVFYHNKKSIKSAILIGITGSIIIGSLSDVFLPTLGTLIFGIKTHLHFPLIEKPILVLLSSLIGANLGILVKKTKLPHTFHVFISIFASLFYLISFSNINTLIDYLISIIIVFFSVLIPCCLSDIVYPNLFIKKTN
ncbi:MAG: hypothetical protein WC260_01245 [Candidatus Pacearchaeota archaeon]